MGTTRIATPRSVSEVQTLLKQAANSSFWRVAA
jgi:hypothetical protein